LGEFNGALFKHETRPRFTSRRAIARAGTSATISFQNLQELTSHSVDIGPDLILESRVEEKFSEAELA